MFQSQNSCPPPGEMLGSGSINPHRLKSSWGRLPLGVRPLMGGADAAAGGTVRWCPLVLWWEGVARQRWHGIQRVLAQKGHGCFPSAVRQLSQSWGWDCGEDLSLTCSFIHSPSTHPNTNRAMQHDNPAQSFGGRLGCDSSPHTHWLWDFWGMTRPSFSVLTVQ